MGDPDRKPQEQAPKRRVEIMVDPQLMDYENKSDELPSETRGG